MELKLNLFVIIVITLLVSGCVNPLIMEEQGHGHQFRSLSLEESEKEAFTKTHFENGLALSGGGIRSAFFSIGVMKGLYDQGLMDDIEVISSVSGGSYANYWFMSTGHHRELESVKAIDEIFPNKKDFNIEACEFSVRGNTVTELSMLAHLSGNAMTYPVSRFTKAISGMSMGELYRCKLERSFGFNGVEGGRGGGFAYPHNLKEEGGIKECRKNDSRSTPINIFQTSVETKKIPYFILNATVQDPVPKTGLFEGVYEFTPLLHGNERYGYHKWEKDSFPLSQLTAISGAAYDPLLEQTIELKHKEGNDIIKRDITLSDGGHSENLGLLALIRRGTKNIISVDAEYDPDFVYQGYFTLKDRLSEWGLTLKNDELDRRKLKSISCRHPGGALMDWCERRADGPPHKGIFKATVLDHNGSLVSNITFIKLSVASEVIPTLRKTCADISPDSNNPNSCYRGELIGPKELETLKKIKISGELGMPSGQNLEALRILKVPADPDIPQDLRRIGDRSTPTKLADQFNSLYESKDLNGGNMNCNNVAPKFDFKSVATEQVLVNLKEHSDFPHRTTNDQNYRQHETYGYMGLGYLYGNLVKWD